jgi:hypothetical protein
VLARRTLLEGEQGWQDDGGASRLALKTAPTGEPPAAVVVTMSLAAMAQLRTAGASSRSGSCRSPSWC